MEKVSEHYTPNSVQSLFKLTFQPSSSGNTGRRPAATGTGQQSTAICGLGWRFTFCVDQSTPSLVVDNGGNPVESFQLQLFFDPHLIRGSAYGTVTLTTRVERLISTSVVVPLEYNLSYHSNSTLGTYIYASSAAEPSISITVTFPAALGLNLTHPLEHWQRMEQALRESLAGKELVDVKFYAFSRKGSEGRRVTHPLRLYANTALLRGYSEDLDALLTGHGFSESAVVDLDLHEPEEHSFEDYGYDSDSDLDSDGEGESPSTPSTREADRLEEANGLEVSIAPAKNSSSGRKGRVIVLKGTAFKTWKALVYYLCTRQINFCPLKSEGPMPQLNAGDDISCSPKSMYRLAEKLGLEDLQALALTSISSRLFKTNILPEVFSEFTSLYPAIQELEINVLTSDFSAQVCEEMKEYTQKICDGERQYCSETLFMIIRKMGLK
ncbi:hypothetical protein B0H16DRAFT_1560369 [Mycena metata]|uniref:BTB domain-containing protein n=1 Tax=Mycena metata TaxID=1033252 RepID=A0AAD7IKZ0_9AGAR|nr:hypothetical protein B0H16DRAFT_1560369 [Mycena metata]